MGSYDDMNASSSISEGSGETNNSLRVPHWIYFGAVVYMVISLGGNDLVTQSVLTLVLIGLLLYNIRSVPGNRRLLWLWLFAISCLFILVGAAFLQSIRLDNHPFEHPIWKIVRDNVGPLEGAISVAPEQTRASLVAFAPLLGFCLSLTLFETPLHALLMLRSLAYFSSSVALFGIVQHLLFPTQLGFSEKQFYLDSLTAFFVNRNSAGTFFGVGATLSLAFAFYYLRSIDPARLGDKLLKPFSQANRSYQMFALFASLALLQSIALFLTQSRGAVGSTFIAMILFIIVMAQERLTRGRTVTLSAPVARLARLGGLVFLVVGVFLLFAGQASYRQETQGVDYSRLCVFKSILAAIRDNWAVGVGFGNFQNVFPAYRDSDCAGVQGVWNAAHNSYLEGTLGLGILFPVIVAAGLIMLAKTFLFGMKVRHHIRFVPIMGLSVLLLVCLHAMVDFSMQIPGVSLFVGTILACSSVLSLERAPTPYDHSSGTRSRAKGYPDASKGRTDFP